MFVERIITAIAREAGQKASKQAEELQKEFLIRREELKQEWDPGDAVTVWESLLWAAPVALAAVIVCFLFDCGVAALVDGTVAGWWHVIVVSVVLWVVLSFVYLGISRVIHGLYKQILTRKLRKHDAVIHNIVLALREKAVTEASAAADEAMKQYHTLREAYKACESAYADVVEEMTEMLQEAMDDAKRSKSMDSHLNVSLFFRIEKGWITRLTRNVMADGSCSYENEDAISAECTTRFFNEGYQTDPLRYTAFVEVLFNAIRSRLIGQEYGPAVSIASHDDHIFELIYSIENPIYSKVFLADDVEAILRKLEERRTTRDDDPESLEC